MCYSTLSRGRVYRYIDWSGALSSASASVLSHHLHVAILDNTHTDTLGCFFTRERSLTGQKNKIGEMPRVRIIVLSCLRVASLSLRIARLVLSPSLFLSIRVSVLASPS
jgi:hypothetical protein